ncbi:MAG TPA: hypothetical protein DCX02_00900 [Firmicutes bacterium]|nr:hypothetical protein [Bacillota bacterium]
MKKVGEFLKKWGIWLLSALGALFSVLTLIKGNRIRGLVNDAETCTKQAGKLAGDARVDAEKQRARIREAEANALKAEELDERLKKIKAKRTFPLIVIIGLLLIGLMAVPVKASELPTDYDSLKSLYFAALDQIVELKLDLEEAIMIAEGYKDVYETEKRLRQEAEEAVTRGLARERELQEIVAKQHKIIMELAGGKLTITGGIVLHPTNLIADWLHGERDKDPLGVFIALSYTL